MENTGFLIRRQLYYAIDNFNYRTMSKSAFVHMQEQNVSDQLRNRAV